LPNIRITKSRNIKCAGHVECMRREEKNAYRVLVRKSEGPRSLGTPRRICGDKIKMDLGETG
jgi:hypothetical protein